MDIIHSILSDPSMMVALALTILSGVAIFLLRYASKKTGVPTDDLQVQMQTIHEQAKAEVVEGVINIVRDRKTGKFVSTKPKILPPNKNHTENPEPVPKEEHSEDEDKEPAKERKLTPGMYMILFLFLIPISSCSFLDAGVKYAQDNIQITWKGEEAKGQPIDSIMIKFEPVYWKEYDTSYLVDSLETETEFIKDGYRVWQLRTPNWKRLEVQRLDTIIYIYKK